MKSKLPLIVRHTIIDTPLQKPHCSRAWKGFDLNMHSDILESAKARYILASFP